MEECISSRTRSSLTSDVLNNWKICDSKFKVPQRNASVILNSTRHKKEIISIIKKEMDISVEKYQTSIHELNYLQSGHVLIFYKNLISDVDKKNDFRVKDDKAYEISRKYFIDESDDSDPEYIEGDEIIDRVMAERCILSRIEELQKNNLWSMKMINKKADPPKPTFHWDLLIKEMKWLQDNMSTAKQCKRVDAKKISTAAFKFVKEKEAQMLRNNKEETVKAKKHCLNLSKMIKEWWKQMQKIVVAKQKFRLDARRQEAINDHLGKVIETTQKYTEWLTEDLKLITSADNDTSTDDDPEFQARDEWTDDEETIDKEEMEIEYNVDEEIQALQSQNEMSLEDILKELPSDYFKSTTEVNNNVDNKELKPFVIERETKIENVDDAGEVEHKYELNNSVIAECTDESNFHRDPNSDDWEETMIEQEEFEEHDQAVNNNLEIDDLKKDAEIPMDKLVELYHKIHSGIKIENDNEEYEEAGDNSSVSSSDLSEFDESMSSDRTSSSYESSVDLGSVFNIDNNESHVQESLEFQGQFKEISEVAMSTQPRGFTLESTDVKVQIPFLLKFSLREYQHVGLDWLAAIYEKRLNGILADEMGLGKTIQTIALLAYLSCEKEIWGPHLVVVPTSVVLNWEIEFKKWCPGFKILTYFGSMKERKEKRKGWTKTNAFHVCITSYKLAIQDSQAFKRKKWKYIILDEAQNIKNFKSQRWQTLLTFNSQRRLLLTGTPLQNNLMELWSLMHFLMPNIFQSHREFNEWFGSPLSGMIEGSNEYNEQLVMRLHKVLRPFILRRLKKDVEKQMPQKYEHIVMCPLSKRQRCLYDDYMSLSSTKEMLSSGQFMSIINILMQLRKVCNHPNLFEDRPTLSPFSMIHDSIDYYFPKMLLIDDIYENRMSNGKYVRPVGTNSLADLSLNLPKFVSERILGLIVKPNLIEEVDNIHVTDWVSKFSEKFTSSPLTTSFIPRDLIGYLEKSEPNDKTQITLPNPLIYGLKIKKAFKSEKNCLPNEILANRRIERVDQLRAMTRRNFIRCSQYTSIGTDIIDLVSLNGVKYSSSWDNLDFNILRKRTLERFLEENMEIVDRVTFVIPAVIACGVRINTSSRSLMRVGNLSETLYSQSTSSIPICLSRIRQNQLVQFPDTRLIEYDCGKLQILVSMLKRLKSEGHRCLLFTQMTRMLDVLEQFLSYHGYRYLRLDGTTKIEQRQIMMEQFNKDERIFVFILSTRSGGVGVNLTGADTVIFYDSDWNPTMDAQAQDRCHRIGQTRDVHIYRLISRMTIEENILKKANEKRCLNEMAIEGGQFNMSFFKANSLQDIFQTPTGFNNIKIVNDESENVKIYKTIRGRTIKWKGDESIFDIPDEANRENRITDSTQLEAALEEVEDESDRLAAKITRAEAKADLVEFDETVPWDDTEDCSTKTDNDENRFRLEMESQLENFNSQLKPLQKYGVSWLEQSCEDLLCSQLEQEETHIENNKQTWELEQIKALHENQEEMKNIEEDDMLYIYGSYDPYAAQKEELEKLRKEEELQQLLQLRKEEELIKIEKNKAAAQAWAQEQHRNALKRKSNDNVNNDEYEKSNSIDNSETFIKSPKQRKVVIPRLELPDESITTMKVINTCLDDVDPPLVSSSSSSMVIENKPFPVRKKMGRPPWKNVFNRQSNNWNTPSTRIEQSSKYNSIENNLSTQSKSFRRKRFSEFNSQNKSMLADKNDEDYQPSRNSFPNSRRLCKPTWKNLNSINYEGNHSLSYLTKSAFPHSKRMGRSTKILSNNQPSLPFKRSFSPSTYGPQHLSSSNMYDKHESLQVRYSQSADENIAPFSKETFNSSAFSDLFNQNFKSVKNASLNSVCNNDVHHLKDRNNFNETQSSINFNNMENNLKKKRGRPSFAEIKQKQTNGNVDRDRNNSESTSTCAVVNKKNSFKIPVKTLNGEHKLFSAPLLLMKTKPVFVITRKIEDNDGNVYTQNLTYPVESNERFDAIAAKLSSFASTSTDK